MNRRRLLLGAGAALAAPAIVRAESLMKIAQLRRATDRQFGMYVNPTGFGLTSLDMLDDYEEGWWTVDLSEVSLERVMTLYAPVVIADRATRVAA